MSAQLALDLEPEAESLDALLADGTLRIHVGERRQPEGDRFVAVISRPAGGSVRHYRLCERGCAHVWLPAHEGHWPEMDALVARELRCEVIGLDRGGVYSDQTIHPVTPRPRATEAA